MPSVTPARACPALYGGEGEAPRAVTTHASLGFETPKPLASRQRSMPTTLHGDRQSLSLLCCPQQCHCHCRCPHFSPASLAADRVFTPPPARFPSPQPRKLAGADADSCGGPTTQCCHPRHGLLSNLVPHHLALSERRQPAYAPQHPRRRPLPRREGEERSDPRRLRSARHHRPGPPRDHHSRLGQRLSAPCCMYVPAL